MNGTIEKIRGLMMCDVSYPAHAGNNRYRILRRMAVFIGDREKVVKCTVPAEPFGHLSKAHTEISSKKSDYIELRITFAKTTLINFSHMPRKLDSVLARFEETIEKNNAVGVCSGMYLTNLACSSTTNSSNNISVSRRHSTVESAPKKAKAGRRTSLGSSLPQIQPGTYRTMLKTADATVSTADTADSDDWDPFNDAATAPARDLLDESFSSIGDCSAASFHDDDDDDDQNDHDENHATPSKTSKIRRERTKDKKSSGRRSTRITKTEKQRRESMSRASSKSNLQVMASLEDPKNKEDDDINDDDDEDDGFALTYVSARDKFTALAKQNSDRQLCKQPSRRKLLSGLKMTSKENLMSGGSHHSSSSTQQRRTLDRSRSNRSLTKAPCVSSTTRRACSDNLLDNVETSKATTTISPKMMIPRSARVSSSNSPPKKSRVNHSSNCGDLSKHSCHNLGRTPPLVDNDSGHNESPVKPLGSRTTKSSIRNSSTSDHYSPVQSHEEAAGRTRKSSHRQRSFTNSRSEH